MSPSSACGVVKVLDHLRGTAVHVPNDAASKPVRLDPRTAFRAALFVFIGDVIASVGLPPRHLRGIVPHTRADTDGRPMLQFGGRRRVSGERLPRSICTVKTKAAEV